MKNFLFAILIAFTGVANAASVTVDDPTCSEFNSAKTGSGSLSITCSQAVIVPPTNAPVCTLYASSASITLGQSVTISATCTGATSVTWANNLFGKYSSGGVVAPSTTTTYSIVGSNASGDSAPAYITVTVSTYTPPQTIPTVCPNNGHPLYVQQGLIDWNTSSGISTPFQNMSNGMAYVYKLAIGSAQTDVAGISLAHGSGLIPQRVVVISETPCDFDAANTDNAYALTFEPSTFFSVGGELLPGIRRLKPNTVYFVNIKNATYDSPYLDTCPVNENCSFILTFRH